MARILGLESMTYAIRARQQETEVRLPACRRSLAVGSAGLHRAPANRTATAHRDPFPDAHRNTIFNIDAADRSDQHADRNRKHPAVAAVYVLQSNFGYDSQLGGGMISTFGSRELDALRDFEARFRLPPDGIVDLLTGRALISIHPAIEPWPSNPP